MTRCNQCNIGDVTSVPVVLFILGMGLVITVILSPIGIILVIISPFLWGKKICSNCKYENKNVFTNFKKWNHKK